MLQLQTVVFAEPKAGSADAEWEDGAGYDGGDPAAGRAARLVVADGATEAYDSIRWVGQLVESFLGLEPAGEPPELTGAGVDEWIRRMQKRWEQEAPARFANVFEERKFHEDGSFATLLGCEVRGLGGKRPQWTAVALGDTVLFQVRGLRQVERFPAVEEFGINPDGVFTAPAARDRMRAALAVAAGTLAAGDRLYLATDAVAEWMVRAEADDPAALWRTLDRLDPAVFRWLVADRRRAGAMKNDDATLMRVRVTDRNPEHLVVCR
jgi:hypothetical protein